MSAKFACNLITTLSQPPWTEELDWSLHTNFDWEKRVPFYAYVQPNCAAPRATEQGSLFPKFGALPTELQLRILALCPANTLFQVMHALPSLRTEASKLFWTMPNASFLIQASWLLDGGYPGFTYIELSFLQYVKRIEIEYSGEAEATICPYDEQGSTTRQELILRFWTSLIQRLLKLVLLGLTSLLLSWNSTTLPSIPTLHSYLQSGGSVGFINPQQAADG
jgi:hypothetical protein